MRYVQISMSDSESYIITVSATSTNPIKAQLLASTIANDYLASQRETRQEALQRVATWLKGRVDDLQSQLSETESSIEKLKAEIGIRDIGSNDVNEKQISELNTQLMNAQRRGRRETCPPRSGASRNRHPGGYTEYPRADCFERAHGATPKTDAVELACREPEK